MTEHHPEWDGFLFYPRVYGQSPTTLQPGIRSAWLRHIGTSQGNPVVLHHAAKFFGYKEPFLAEELLLRAIRMEPGEPFHQEGLAVLYAREANMPMHHPSFAEHAKAQLLLSNDPMVWAAALNGLLSYPPGSRDPWRSILHTRLGEAREDLIRKLPSQSEKYRNARCPVSAAEEVRRGALTPYRHLAGGHVSPLSKRTGLPRYADAIFRTSSIRSFVSGCEEK